MYLRKIMTFIAVYPPHKKAVAFHVFSFSQLRTQAAKVSQTP